MAGAHANDTAILEPHKLPQQYRQREKCSLLETKEGVHLAHRYWFGDWMSQFRDFQYACLYEGFLDAVSFT